DGHLHEGLEFLRSLPGFISPFTLAIIAKVCGAGIERADPRWVVASQTHGAGIAICGHTLSAHCLHNAATRADIEPARSRPGVGDVPSRAALTSLMKDVQQALATMRT